MSQDKADATRAVSSLSLAQASSALQHLNAPVEQVIARIDPAVMEPPQFDMAAYKGPVCPVPPGYGPPVAGYLALDRKDVEALEADGKKAILALVYPDDAEKDDIGSIYARPPAVLFNYMRGYYSGSKETNHLATNILSHIIGSIPSGMWGTPEHPAFILQPDGITLSDAPGTPVHIKRREPISIDPRVGRIMPETVPLPDQPPPQEALLVHLANYLRNADAPQVMANLNSATEKSQTGPFRSGVGLLRSEQSVSYALNQISELSSAETRERFWRDFLQAPYAAEETHAAAQLADWLGSMVQSRGILGFGADVPGDAMPPQPDSWDNELIKAIRNLLQQGKASIENADTPIQDGIFRQFMFDQYLRTQEPALFQDMEHEANKGVENNTDASAELERIKTVLTKRLNRPSAKMKAAVEAFLAKEGELAIESGEYFTIRSYYPKLMEFLKEPLNMDELAKRFGDAPLPCFDTKNRKQVESMIGRFKHWPLRNLNVIAFSPDRVQAPSNNAPCKFRLPDLHGLTSVMTPEMTEGVLNGEQHRPDSDIFAIRAHLYAHVAAAALKDYANYNGWAAGWLEGYANPAASQFKNYMGEPLSLMLPDVATADEVAALKQAMWSHLEKEISTSTMKEKPDHVPVRFGCMIETKEACENIKGIAAQCDFISFGTNDLTAALTGLRREDYDGQARWMKEHGYEQLGRSPFEVLVPEVIAVMDKTVAEARAANPAIKIGICGHQISGHDRRSLEAAYRMGVDSISVQNSMASMQRAIFGMAQMAAQDKLAQKIRD